MSTAVALVILLGIAWLANRNSSHLIQHNADLIQAYQIGENLQRLRTLLREAQSGRRGYLITNDSLFLIPHNDAV